MKTIHEYFALTEEEYKVTFLSYFDFTKEDYLNLIQIALQKYDLREFEIKPAKPFSTNPPQFPTLTFGTLYTIEATIGQMPRGLYEQLKLEIAQTTRIPMHYLFASEDGNVPQVKSGKADDEALLSQAMGESPRDFPEDDKGVQELVGQQSVEQVMKNMEDRRKAREEESKAISESITYKTTHSILKEHTGKSYKKGVYEFTVLDGEITVGDRKDELAEGVFVKDIEQLQETLKPEVPSFAEKYKISKFLNESHAKNDITEHLNHMIALFEQKHDIDLARKSGYDNHQTSIGSIDCHLDAQGIGEVCLADNEIKVTTLYEIAAELNWDNVILGVHEGREGLCIKFEWHGDLDD